LLVLVPWGVADPLCRDKEARLPRKEAKPTDSVPKHFSFYFEMKSTERALMLTSHVVNHRPILATVGFISGKGGDFETLVKCAGFYVTLVVGFVRGRHTCARVPGAFTSGPLSPHPCVNSVFTVTAV
jgi:hypothetical protein